MDASESREEKIAAAKKKLEKFKKKRTGIASISGATTSSSISSNSPRQSLDIDPNAAISPHQPAAPASNINSNGFGLHRETLAVSSTASGSYPLAPLLPPQISTSSSPTSSLISPLPTTSDDLQALVVSQRQTITLLVSEKSALTADLEKYMHLAERVSSSDSLLFQGKQIVEGLRNQVTKLEEELLSSNEKYEVMQSKYADGMRRLQGNLEEADARRKLAEREITVLQTRLKESPTGSERVQVLEKQLNDKEEYAEAVELEVSKLNGEVRRLTSELEQQKGSLEEAKEVMKERDNMVKMSVDELQEARSDLASSRKDLKDTESRLKQLQIDYESLRKESEESNIQLKDMTQQRETLSQSLEVASIETIKLSRRVADLQQKTEGLQADNRQLMSQLDELRLKVVAVSDEKVDFVSNLEVATNQLTFLTKRLQETEVKEAKLREQLDGVDDQVAKRVADQMRVMEEEAAEHWAEAQRLQGVVDAKNEQITALEAEISFLREKHASRNGSVSRGDDDVLPSSIKDDIQFAPLKEHIGALQDHHMLEMSKLESRLRSVQTQVFAEQTKNNALERKVQQLQDELDHSNKAKSRHGRTISAIAVTTLSRSGNSSNSRNSTRHNRSQSELALDARMARERSLSVANRGLRPSIQMGGCPGCLGQVYVI